VTCVKWSHLLTLRSRYNSLWDRLDSCSMAEGSKYGVAPHLEEIEDFPVGTGFFRIQVQSTVADPLDYPFAICDGSQIDFIVTGGDLLTKLNSPAFYGYFNYPEGTWYARTIDACTGCRVFLPSSPSDPTQSIFCPAGNYSRNIYGGFKALQVAEAGSFCGEPVDWGASESLEDIRAAVNLFKCAKLVPEPDVECEETIEVCCGITATGHYQAVYDPSYPYGADYVLMILKTVDYMGNGSTGEGYIAITLSRLITGTFGEAAEVKSRVESILPLFSSGTDGFCDPCGPDTISFCKAPNKGIKCTTALTYDMLAELKAVTGSEDCQKCGESFSGLICLCPWMELASIISLLQCFCIRDCEDGCECPCENGGETGCECGTDACCCDCGYVMEINPETGQSECVYVDAELYGDPECPKCFSHCADPCAINYGAAEPCACSDPSHTDSLGACCCPDPCS